MCCEWREGERGGQKGANARWFETNSEQGMKKMRIWKAKINEDPARTLRIGATPKPKIKLKLNTSFPAPISTKNSNPTGS